MPIIVVTSTLPYSANDPVPTFVADQVDSFVDHDPSFEVHVLAPHDSFPRPPSTEPYSSKYMEHRFHYFWPRRAERLTGRGILPAIRSNIGFSLLIPFFGVAQLISLFFLCRRIRPTLIYAHWFTPQAINSAIVSKLLGTGLVFTTHASDVSVLGTNLFSRSLIRYVCRRASAYTAVSQRTANKLRCHFAGARDEQKLRDKLQIIPMGVRLNKIPKSQAEEKARESQCTSTAKPYFLFIGRIAEKKGVRFLLDAFDYFAQTHSQYQLLIAGDGHLRSALECQAQRMQPSRVHFLGHVFEPEKSRLARNAVAICLPSIIDSYGDSEGLPLVLMESLSVGALCIASNTSGAENVITNGIDGLLVPERDVFSLADAMTKAAALPLKRRQEISEHAMRTSQQFSYEEIMPRYAQLIRKAEENAL